MLRNTYTLYLMSKIEYFEILVSTDYIWTLSTDYIYFFFFFWLFCNIKINL
jgi:hypothetical protein